MCSRGALLLDVYDRNMMSIVFVAGDHCCYSAASSILAQHTEKTHRKQWKTLVPKHTGCSEMAFTMISSFAQTHTNLIASKFYAKCLARWLPSQAVGQSRTGGLIAEQSTGFDDRQGGKAGT